MLSFRDLFRFGTNVHLDSNMTRLEFSDQRSKFTVTENTFLIVTQVSIDPGLFLTRKLITGILHVDGVMI